MQIGWDIFPIFATLVVLFSSAGAWWAWRKEQRQSGALLCAAIGVGLLALFVALLWITLQRPPLRTMGETRLWYSLFLLTAGLFTYARWHYRWILSFSTLLATVFLVINLLKPEIHDQTLMPALQSGWFVPHVTSYMFSYGLLGCATLMALYGWIRHKESLEPAIDRLLYSGLSLFTIGMLTGSLWAKEAWGSYWSWDPKEAWAVATWGLYLLAIHRNGMGRKSLYGLLLVAFLSLQICWYGVNYLPSAKTSVHTYNQQ